MVDLLVRAVDGEADLEDWRHVHNVVVPAAAMSLDEARERIGHYHLEVAYFGDVLVGCSTVRPPAGGSPTATVIARVLPEHRRQGFGREIYRRALGTARALGGEPIETIVWASNVDGLRFATRRGFVEVSREVFEDDDIPYITLRLTGREHQA